MYFMNWLLLNFWQIAGKTLGQNGLRNKYENKLNNMNPRKKIYLVCFKTFYLVLTFNHIMEYEEY